MRAQIPQNGLCYIPTHLHFSIELWQLCCYVIRCVLRLSESVASCEYTLYIDLCSCHIRPTLSDSSATLHWFWSRDTIYVKQKQCFANLWIPTGLLHVPLGFFGLLIFFGHIATQCSKERLNNIDGSYISLLIRLKRCGLHLYSEPLSQLFVECVICFLECQHQLFTLRNRNVCFLHIYQSIKLFL